MTWKFWKKTPPRQQGPATPEDINWPTDAYSSVRMLAGMFAKQDELVPFIRWRADGVELTDDVAGLAEIGTKGVMLAIWFWKFRDDHGDIAATMVRDEFLLTMADLNPDGVEMIGALLNMMDRSRDTYVKRPVEENRAQVGDETIELPFAWFAAVSILTEATDSPYYQNVDAVASRGDDMAVAQCVEHGIEQCRLLWEPMLKRLTPFNPADFPRWKWSDKPGSHERHLQRRCQNPLFPAGRRVVNAADVYYARVVDAQDWENLRRDIGAIHNEINKGDLDIDWHTQLNGLREKLDDLDDRLVTVAGDNQPLEQALAHMRDHIMQTWKVALGTNQVQLDKLAEAEAMHARDRAARSIWAHQARAAKVQTEEMVPSLLSESVDEIRRIPAVIPDVMPSVRKEALTLVMRVLSEGHKVPDHREKLAVLGVAI